MRIGNQGDQRVQPTGLGYVPAGLAAYEPDVQATAPARAGAPEGPWFRGTYESVVVTRRLRADRERPLERVRLWVVEARKLRKGPLKGPPVHDEVRDERTTFADAAEAGGVSERTCRVGGIRPGRSDVHDGL